MVSKEELIAEIHRLADGAEPPTRKEFQEQAKHASSTVWRKLGSWNEALTEAGYQPHVRRNISQEVLLKQLHEDISEEFAPAYVDFGGKYHPGTYSRQFGSWWQACVRAGFKPSNNRPLTTTQSRKFFEAAVGQQDAEDRLIGLLVQFTGLPLDLLPKLSESWTTFRECNAIVKVPSAETTSGDIWTFQLPAAWTDKDHRRETELPGLLKWYLQTHESIQKTPWEIRKRVFSVADDADLDDREHTDQARIGTVPLVRPTDLRVTGGIQMARNGAPARRIQRHLGINHTGWEITVDDIFAYCEVHDNRFSHPDYTPRSE